MQNRREFLKSSAAGGAGLFLSWSVGTAGKVTAAVGGLQSILLDPTSIPKFVTPLKIPAIMPKTGVFTEKGVEGDYYEVALREFKQHILPQSMGLGPSTVWGYGSAKALGSFSSPACTIEAKVGRPVRIKWINGLMDNNRRFLKHPLAVDQTLHWANPPGGVNNRDGRGSSQLPYDGPVPMVPHLHGAHAEDHSDGYSEAWFLPAASNIPKNYATTGTWYEYFKDKFKRQHGITWEPGTATFQYQNQQDPAALWFHDHALGMTRNNVYMGGFGLYLLRGDQNEGIQGKLPACGAVNSPTCHEIPLVIQDRSFNPDGSLFYPSHRAFFEGLQKNQLKIPFIPEDGCGGPSDVSPLWNAETFGNCMVVNGQTWPFLNVERRRYRFRVLNASNARFLLLKLSNGMPFCQIGTDGGYLPGPLERTELLLGPAERADILIDFSKVPSDSEILLLNLAPDEPYGGGVPDSDFAASDPQTTGQVMKFRVTHCRGVDSSTPGMDLILPKRKNYGPPNLVRQVSINELESSSVRVVSRPNGNIVMDCSDEAAPPFGPTTGQLGIVNTDGTGVPLMWEEAVTENPSVGSTEIWEIYNFTEDAHPIHIHQNGFEILNRQAQDGTIRPPEAWESGLKDTVVVYPGEITRVKTYWDISGRFAWHCHILEHEDNEMMRPIHVGPIQA